MRKRAELLAESESDGVVVKVVLGLMIASVLHAQIDEAELAFRSGDTAHAVALAHATLMNDPASVRAHMVLGVIAAQANDWKEAGAHFEAVVQLVPQNPQGYFYLGQANLYQQKWEIAARVFQRCFRKELSRPQPRAPGACACATRSRPFQPGACQPSESIDQ